MEKGLEHVLKYVLNYALYYLSLLIFTFQSVCEPHWPNEWQEDKNKKL